MSIFFYVFWLIIVKNVNEKWKPEQGSNSIVGELKYVCSQSAASLSDLAMWSIAWTKMLCNKQIVY